ncbi:MAG: hypothetical protein FOGNACKC_05947 [Anaerolineae bacterium]|nr:hypothetical protein [Anaerolineae bacterium]
MVTFHRSPGLDYGQKASEQQQKIAALITRLGGKRGIDRQRARQKLVKIGNEAVVPLIDAFRHNRAEHVHWEAAKALSKIGSQQAVNVLIEALDDEDAGVRWLAAEGLVAIGQSAVRPLLKTLEQNSGSVRLREGAHHIVHDFIDKRILDDTYQTLLKPVLWALEDIEPVLEVPVAASEALRTLSDLGDTDS